MSTVIKKYDFNTIEDGFNLTFVIENLMRDINKNQTNANIHCAVLECLNTRMDDIVKFDKNNITMEGLQDMLLHAVVGLKNLIISIYQKSIEFLKFMFVDLDRQKQRLNVIKEASKKLTLSGGVPTKKINDRDIVKAFGFKKDVTTEGIKTTLLNQEEITNKYYKLITETANTIIEEANTGINKITDGNFSSDEYETLIRTLNRHTKSLFLYPRNISGMTTDEIGPFVSGKKIRLQLSNNRTKVEVYDSVDLDEIKDRPLELLNPSEITELLKSCENLLGVTEKYKDSKKVVAQSKDRIVDNMDRLLKSVKQMKNTGEGNSEEIKVLKQTLGDIYGLQNMLIKAVPKLNLLAVKKVLDYTEKSIKIYNQ